MDDIKKAYYIALANKQNSHKTITQFQDLMLNFGLLFNKTSNLLIKSKEGEDVDYDFNLFNLLDTIKTMEENIQDWEQSLVSINSNFTAINERLLVLEDIANNIDPNYVADHQHRYTDNTTIPPSSLNTTGVVNE